MFNTFQVIAPPPPKKKTKIFFSDLTTQPATSIHNHKTLFQL